MPRSERALPRWASWAIGLGLVVVAWFAALVTPGDDDIVAPFPVAGEIGEAAEGRNLAVTVTDVRRASEVNSGGWSAEGNWLVVDLDAASVVTDASSGIRHAVLEIDGVRYRASERPDSLLAQPLSTGVPRSGSLAFELSEKIAAGEAVLELAVNDRDQRLDSMILIGMDIEDVPEVGDAELTETGWARP